MYNPFPEIAVPALKSGEREFRLAIQVDWNKDGTYTHPLSNLTPWVSHASTDRSLKGSAPEELMLVEGASAAELEFTMNGEYEGLPLSSIFSPYNGNSPLYQTTPIGAEVNYQIGLDTPSGTVWYPQFIGRVRTITPNRNDNSVTITALDRVEELRRPVSLPPWAIEQRAKNEGYVYGQLINTGWVVDSALRQCGVSPTPWRPTFREELGVAFDDYDGVQCWVTGNGGWLPTIGWANNTIAQTFPAEDYNNDVPPTVDMYQYIGQPHPLLQDVDFQNFPGCFRGLKGQQGDHKTYWVNDRNQIDTPGTHYLGLTILLSNGSGGQDPYPFSVAEHAIWKVNIGNKRECRIMIGGGQLWTEREYHADGNTFYSNKIDIPTGVWSVDVFASWDTTEESGTSVYFQVGNLYWPTTKVWDPFNGQYDEDNNKGLCTLTHRVAVQDVFYASRSLPNVNDEVGVAKQPATYAADIDYSYNRLSYTPTEKAEAWQIITDAAAAEFASVFWDEQGIFHFWSQQHILDIQEQPRARTFSLDEVSGLQITDTLESVRNIITVTGANKYGSSGPVYEAQNENQFVVPPATQIIFRLEVDDVQTPGPDYVVEYQGLDTGTPKPVWNDDIKNGFVAQYFLPYGENGTGPWGWWEAQATNNLTVNAFYGANGVLNIKVVNLTTNATLRLARNTTESFDQNDNPVAFNTIQEAREKGPGEPALHIDGTKIYSGDPLTILGWDYESAAKYGARAYDLQSDWIQEYYFEVGMTDRLLDRITKPIPTTDAVEISGDPRLQLGDCVDVKDPDGLGETVSLQIYGIKRHFSLDNGLVDTLTVEMLQPAGIGVWDSPQYGKWDDTFTWS